MLPAVAMPRLQMKVRAMIRPNNVSEIRSIEPSTRKERISETADIKAALAQSWGSVLVAILADGRDLSAHIVGAKIACRRESHSSTLCWTPSACNQSVARCSD